MHGTDADVGDFGGARQAERVGHHFGDVLRLREIRWASVATRAKSVCLLRDIFKQLAAPRHQADFSAVPG